MAFLYGCTPPAPQQAILPSAADVCRRVDTLSPSLDPSSPQAKAAVLLLLAREAGLNVDRLARLSGYERHFVAACVRRLYDNGVWAGGRTCYAWTEPCEAAFWNDVGVAVGRLCRRTDEEGNPAWAPAGSWTKVYDFVPRVAVEGPAVSFVSTTPEEIPVLRAPAARFPGEATAEPEPRPHRAPAPRLREEEAVEERPDWLPAWLGGSGEPALGVLVVAPASAAPDLFPGASWLG